MQCLSGLFTDYEEDNRCILVSAACRALGHKRLYHRIVIIMRVMRKHVLEQRPEMQPLLDSYYVYAPQIVAAVKKSGQADIIYQDLWEHYILPITNLVFQRNYDSAMALYVKMVYEQMIRFQMNVPQSLLKEAEDFIGNHLDANH